MAQIVISGAYLWERDGADCDELISSFGGQNRRNFGSNFQQFCPAKFSKFGIPFLQRSEIRQFCPLFWEQFPRHFSCILLILWIHIEFPTKSLQIAEVGTKKKTFS